MKKYGICTMCGEDGGEVTFFDTLEEAKKEAKMKAEEDWYEEDDLRRMYEEVDEYEVNEDGEEEFVNSIECYPYIQDFKVARNFVGRHTDNSEEAYWLEEKLEARTPYMAAKKYWRWISEADREATKLRVRTEDGETMFYSEKDFR